MRCGILCRNGPKVSEICLITITLDEDRGWGNSKEENRKIL